MNHGTLLDLIGVPRVFDNILFAPALLDVDWSGNTLEYRFDEHLERDETRHRKWRLPETRYGLWVRARIPSVFRFAPLRCANNWQPLINLSFLAIGQFEPVSFLAAVPFICTEGFATHDTLKEEPLIGVSFGTHGPDQAVKDRIARSFWALLLSEPVELTAFDDYYFNEGQYWSVGYERGEFYEVSRSESESFSEIEDHPDPHGGFYRGELFRCFDCDGTGLEDIFPFTEDCATCGGTGLITW